MQTDWKSVWHTKSVHQNLTFTGSAWIHPITTPEKQNVLGFNVLFFCCSSLCTSWVLIAVSLRWFHCLKSRIKALLPLNRNCILICYVWQRMHTRSGHLQFVLYLLLNPLHNSGERKGSVSSCSLCLKIKLGFLQMKESLMGSGVILLLLIQSHVFVWADVSVCSVLLRCWFWPSVVDSKKSVMTL